MKEVEQIQAEDKIYYGIYDNIMYWDGEKINTYGELFNIVVDIYDRKDIEKRDLFINMIKHFYEECHFQNINYLLGYLNKEKETKIKRFLWSKEDFEVKWEEYK